MHLAIRKFNKKFPEPCALITAVHYRQASRLLNYTDTIAPSFKAPRFAVVMSNKPGASRDGAFSYMTSEKIQAYAWQSWYKGLFVGGMFGALVGAAIQALFVGGII